MAILNGAVLLERARRHADDTIAPYYISDTEMYQYISEAERALATAGKLLRSVEQYAISNKDRWLRLREIPELLEIRTAVLETSGGDRRPLKLVGTLDTPIGAQRSSNYDYGLSTGSYRLTPGVPGTLILGKRTNFLEISPPSNGEYTIELSVIHYPMHNIETATDQPSIGERHHAAIAIGAALFALEGSEHEQLRDKIVTLNTAWQRALARAAEESGAINRDAAGPVFFSNDLW